MFSLAPLKVVEQWGLKLPLLLEGTVSLYQSNLPTSITVKLCCFDTFLTVFSKQVI